MPAPQGAAVGWHCRPDPECLGRLGRLTPDGGWVGSFGGLKVNAALNPRASWRGTGWLGRCAEKGLAVSFLLQTPRGEAGGGGTVSMRAALSGGGNDINPSSRAHHARGGLGLAQRHVGRWFTLPGTRIPLRGKRCCRGSLHVKLKAGDSAPGAASLRGSSPGSSRLAVEPDPPPLRASVSRAGGFGRRALRRGRLVCPAWRKPPPLARLQQWRPGRETCAAEPSPGRGGTGLGMKPGGWLQSQAGSTWRTLGTR